MIFPKRESNPAVLKKLVERIKMTEQHSAGSSNPMHGTTAVGILCHTQDYVVAVHVADFETAKRIRDYISSLVTATPSETAERSFQERVHDWMLQCFGAPIAADTQERTHRFLEEALELVQASGCTKAEALQLVDYAYGRDRGVIAEEAGDVMITLAALCQAFGISMERSAEEKAARNWERMEVIRAKQAAKPKHSPLPGPALKALPPQCSCDPNPSIGGSPPCPVHDGESEDV